jgi:acyl-CoA thioester hydrolase
MHVFQVRVYYEDTDLAGIVYYANYLKFIERARSEWVRGLGIDQRHLREAEQIVFAVRRVEADYLRPGRFDDLLEVRTALVSIGGARMDLDQQVWRGPEHLFEARVTLVAMHPETGRATRLPDALRAQLQG